MTGGPGVRVEVRIQPDDGVAVVVVEGEIDLASADVLGDALDRAAGPDARRCVVVDLSAASYVDSSGFRALHRAATRARVLLVVPDASPLARAVRLAGLPTLMAVFGSLDAALPER